MGFITGPSDWVRHIDSLTLCVDAVVYCVSIAAWSSGSGVVDAWLLSVLCRCWLGHLACKSVPEMIYNVSSKTLYFYSATPIGILQDMSEIISYMSSGLWSDRRDGLLALQQYIDNQNPMS